MCSAKGISDPGLIEAESRHAIEDSAMNQEITNPFAPVQPMRAFDEIKISLASPEEILAWSFGEVKKP